jgi:hypothetical protein
MEVLPKWIFESPDLGNTVYRRKIGTTEKELICSSEPDLFTYYDFKDMITLSKDNSSLKKALDNLQLIYYTVKDERQNRT